MDRIKRAIQHPDPETGNELLRDLIAETCGTLHAACFAAGGEQMLLKSERGFVYIVIADDRDRIDNVAAAVEAAADAALYPEEEAAADADR